MKNKSAIISLSGGLDSLTLLHHIIKMGYGPITAVHFQYGSKHNQYELSSAIAIARHFDVQLHVVSMVDVFALMAEGSALMTNEQEIPEGHYNDENMKQTVVPGRNGMFIMALAGIAETKEIPYIFIGAHKGDHHIYPDCREEFLDIMNKAVLFQTEHRVSLKCHFVAKDKKDIVKLGLEMQTPFVLSRTCYKDQPEPCGKCGSCRERLEAFELNNTTDPAEYEGW